MKPLIPLFITAMCCLALFSSCKKGETVADPPPPADPAGTVTVSINYTANPIPIILYQNLDEEPEQGWPYVQVKVGIRNASINFEFDAIQSDNIYIGHPYLIHHGLGGEIACVGSVQGLGAVTAKPAGGWNNICAVEAGKGYVVRYRHTKNYTTSALPYHYARLYVTSLLESTSGGIIGAKVKYQAPWN